jgi:D-3-phosphoglycerate dehydrogenase
MQVGRQEIGGQAVMLLSVDNGIPASALEKISALEGIQTAKLVRF